jgi:hypothetical protein
VPLFMDVHEIAGGVAMDDAEAPDAHQASSTIGAIAPAATALTGRPGLSPAGPRRISRRSRAQRDPHTRPRPEKEQD